MCGEPSRIWVNEQTYDYDEENFLLNTLGLPTIAEVAKAAPRAPYVAIVVALDLDLTRRLAAEVDSESQRAIPDDAAMVTSPLGEELLGAAARLVALLNRPKEIPFMAPLLEQEILYRLLMGPIGARIRDVARLGSQDNRVAQAAAWLRMHFNQHIPMKDFAGMWGGGLSTMNRRFRQLTKMSPLQYQKQMRLHEARRLLLSEDTDAASVAFRVGYESATQLNRDYRRLFGTPPMRNVRNLKKLRAVG